MANIESKQLGEFLQHQTQDTVEKDRDQQATITAIPSWATTGEVKAVLLNGDVIWVSASGNLQELTVDAVIWVRKFGVGQRSQYRMTGYWKDSGGTYRAPSIRTDVMADSKVSELWASDLDPQAVDVDASGNLTINPAGGDQDTIIESENEDQIFVVDAGADEVRIGDRDTNYTQLSVDGTQTMVGTARAKKILIISVATTAAFGAAVPPLDVTGNYLGRLFDIDDLVYFDFEVPYDCDPSDDLDIEVHWFIDEAQDDPGGANEEQVQWQADYTATREDGTEAVDAATTQLKSGDVAIPLVAKYLVQTAIGALGGGTYEQDDVIGVKLSRVDIDDHDDPAGDPVALSVEIEYTVNKLGEDMA